MTDLAIRSRVLTLTIVVLCACTGLKDAEEICTGPVRPIHEVQGQGSSSPLDGDRVTVRGVVVGDFQPKDQLGGFFLQDLKADEDPTTSEGIFVYASAEDVTIGDLVQASGRVKEYGDLTELTEVDEVTVCRSGKPPDPAQISLTRVDDLEPYEGMLVTLVDDLTVASSHDLAVRGQLLLAAGGRPFKHTNGDIPESAQGRRLLLDDGSPVENPPKLPYLDSSGTRRVGDTVSGLIGIISEQDDSHVLHPTIPPSFKSANPRAAEPPKVDGNLRVVAFNLLNFFTTFGARGASDADELELQRAKHVATISALAADIVGLSELENNGETAIRDLVDALNASAEEGDWTHVADPAGGLGDDVIRVGLIYRSQAVRPVGLPKVDRDPVFERPPFAQTFEADGERFTVVVNHFKSKSCRKATGSEKDAGDGQGCWNPRRVRQARRLLEFVAQLQAESGDADVLVIGDLNAYGAEDPIRALTDGGLIDLAAAHVPAAKRYSYVYGGESGYLDHALATPSLAERVTGTAFWHINADEPSFLAYDSPEHRRPDHRRPEHHHPDHRRPDPYRSSDHDPILVGLSF